MSPASQNGRLGVPLMLLSIGLITIVDTVAKYLTAELHGLEIVWGYFVGISAYLALHAAATAGRGGKFLASKRPLLQIVRAGALSTSIASLFVGLTYLPIADATAISFMSPLFIVALSVPLLHERVTVHRWVAVLVGLAGVLVIIRPGGGIAHWAAFMPLISAVCFGFYQIFTRMLAASDDMTTTLYFTGFGGLLWTTMFMAPVWTPPTLAHWLIFAGLGALGVAAHLSMIKAFQLAPASLLAPFNYSKLIWATLFGYLVFGDFPSLNTLAGCSLIIASGFYLILRERRPTE